MQSVLTRTRLGFDLRDHQPDIVIEPNRAWRWKDEDELDICVKAAIEPRRRKDYSRRRSPCLRGGSSTIEALALKTGDSGIP